MLIIKRQGLKHWTLDVLVMDQSINNLDKGNVPLDDSDGATVETLLCSLIALLVGTTQQIYQLHSSVLGKIQLSNAYVSAKLDILLHNKKF